ncbi:hypothetical protein [Vibrio mangrovi]|uniref:Uncharacterized protein n=1 Tax=Vibrio mangrovi TaxID=474394 RepID=A0A1Y6J168_9VIBR|nr:hypothetical protein [Vibrio mangrovi]MDW6005505.1 hypothetical protein [Vibrio mangrovi]SMS02053.1 hypothetical protein VIM7927_03367 [Vibrio mangrovi]
MSTFFTESQLIDVSYIDNNGWWCGNGVEHVAAGTTLGADCTPIVYVPSAGGKIARFNPESRTWSAEIDDMTSGTYYSETGEILTIGVPDGIYPEGAITATPPDYDKNSQAILYVDGVWKVYRNQIGSTYWDHEGNEHTIAELYFDLPEGCTLEQPPQANDECVVRLIDGQWQQVKDYRGRIAYAKDQTGGTDENYEITELGDVPETHTVSVPDLFDSWDYDSDSWTYDIEKERLYKAAVEKNWRDEQLRNVLDRIDQYEKDQNYEEAYRTSPLSETEYAGLLGYRKLLCDYPESEDFPFGERPELSYPEPAIEQPKPTVMRRVLNKITSR